MSVGDSKWSWSTLEHRISQTFSGKNRSPKAFTPIDTDEEDNPWFRLHSPGVADDTFSSSSSKQGNDSQASSGNRARWLSDESSPYGFSDEDGTLKQVDGSNWRTMFGPGKHRRFVPSKTSKWQTDAEPKEHQAARVSGSTWVMQSLVAVVLVICGIYTNHATDSISQKIHGVYESAFQTDYSDVTIPTLERILQKYNISLPVFHTSSGAIRLHVPVTGQIKEDFTEGHPQISIEGASGDSVLAAGSGTVTQVDATGNRFTIAIDHGALGTTSYAGLGDATVTVGQSIASGEMIGHLPKESHPILQFAVKRNGQYVNPHDVIHFSDSGV